MPTVKPWYKREWYALLLCGVVLLSILIKLFASDIYYIPSASMSPTLVGQKQGGDRVLVNKLAYLGSSPRNGDIIVFKTPSHWTAEGQGDDIIKRVIAVQGQIVSVNEEGRITVDGVVLDEPYVVDNPPFVPGELDCHTTPKSNRCFPTVTVPTGQLWVLGDNRTNSADSSYLCHSTDSQEACQGPVPVSNVVGKATRVVFPFSRAHKLH